MIFLIEYHRSEGRIVQILPFESSERSEAQRVRLNLEIQLHHRGIDNEVVLLEARDEAALRKTHRRYFEDAGAIGRSTE